MSPPGDITWGWKAGFHCCSWFVHLCPTAGRQPHVPAAGVGSKREGGRVARIKQKRGERTSLWRNDLLHFSDRPVCHESTSGPTRGRAGIILPLPGLRPSVIRRCSTTRVQPRWANMAAGPCGAATQHWRFNHFLFNQALLPRNPRPHPHPPFERSVAAEAPSMNQCSPPSLYSFSL